MAVIDLHDVAHVSRIPIGTLRRWACEGRWQAVGIRAGRKLYDWDTVEQAVRERQQRKAA